MESTDSASIPSLSGAQKAAIVLVALGPAGSAGILKLMRSDETDKLAKAIAQLDRVTPEHVQSTLEEFGKYVTSQGLYVKGGLEYASKLLIEVYGSAGAQPLIDRLAKSISNEAVNFENFRKTDPQQLAKFIQDEHPQTI
ncbi:MAG: flagellar motor switch protein FliG, partial [Acidobacteriaceae bacterium]|nr:flagellar motor switch protein FliG [Acidobacteriaceae bacterium]